MGNFLSAAWEPMYFQEFVKESIRAITSHEIDENDYLFNCIEKVSKIEKDQSINFNVSHRCYALIRPIVHKLYERKYNELEDMLSKISKVDIPLATSVVLIALNEYSCQYANIKEEEKYVFKSTILKLFCVVKDRLMLYEKKTQWRYNLERIFNDCLQQTSDAIDHYSLTKFIYCLVYLYKKMNNIEADYLSLIYTGRTWDENRIFINTIIPADDL